MKGLFKMEDKFSQVKERIFEHLSKEIDSLKEEIDIKIQIIKLYQIQQ